MNKQLAIEIGILALIGGVTLWFVVKRRGVAANSESPSPAFMSTDNGLPPSFNDMGALGYQVATAMAKPKAKESFTIPKPDGLPDEKASMGFEPWLPGGGTAQVQMGYEGIGFPPNITYH